MTNAHFIRKASTTKDVLAELVAFKQRHPAHNGERYYIAEERVVSPEEWADLNDDLLKDRDWLKAFNDKHYPDTDDGIACIRVTTADAKTAIIIDPQGYNYARYTTIENIDDSDTASKAMTKDEVEAYIKRVAGAFGFIAERTTWSRCLHIHEPDTDTLYSTHFLNFRIDEETVDEDWEKFEFTNKLRFSASIATMGGNPTTEELLKASDTIARGARLVKLLNDDDLTYTFSAKPFKRQ